MKTLFRYLKVTGVAAVVGLVVVGAAMAQTTVTTPPTADATDLLPILYTVAAALLAAVLAVLAGVFLAKVPFAVVNMVRKAIHRLMGRAKPAAG